MSRRLRLQTSKNSNPRKCRLLDVAKTQTLNSMFSKIITNYRPRAVSLSLFLLLFFEIAEHVQLVITQRTTRSSGNWTDILISIKCLEGTNETEYINESSSTCKWNSTQGVKFTILLHNWQSLACPQNAFYILIRYPAQTNIKHLSCNKQPQLGCVNTSRVRPSLLCLHQQNGWK